FIYLLTSCRLLRCYFSLYFVFTYFFCIFISFFYSFFFFNDTATTEIYTLSLHDALPIFSGVSLGRNCSGRIPIPTRFDRWIRSRSEEHTSELQSRVDLVCRLLLEKKKKKRFMTIIFDNVTQEIYYCI